VSAVLSIEDVWVHYGDLPAVRGATLDVEPGQVAALIGETGCGKSSLALATARLLPANARITGRIVIDGQDIVPMSREELQTVRGIKVGFVTQDAMAALNPVLPVRRQIGEMFEVHRGRTRSEGEELAVEALRSVQIHDPEAVARLYPHQLSGGMRQRVMIAMALALSPPLIVADEPTTALDVSTQGEILRLVAALQHELGTSILWITHDMGVVAELADIVAVMYAGRIVEQGSAEQVFDAPRHPYTEALLRTLRDLRGGARGRQMYQVPGQPPPLDSAITGCPFHPRCERASQVCTEVDPHLEVSDGARVACHHPKLPVPEGVGG
jgi:oligopeptide/dipeptide ABC transporter ATP-binding protein